MAAQPGTVPGKHGTFDDCIAACLKSPRSASTCYLTPIHPIGMTNRKGKNNSLKPGRRSRQPPTRSWQGGHDAVHPDLGTLDDFRRFVDACQALNMEVALDFAIQCSPDHPWLKHRTGSSAGRTADRYAENPPKKYEDIVIRISTAPTALRGRRCATSSVLGEPGRPHLRVDNPASRFHSGNG